MRVHTSPSDSATAMLHTFMNLDIETPPGVIAPRLETELLGGAAIEIVARTNAAIVIDMCCGSGNLALAIAAAHPQVRVYASDLTDETTAAARHNVERLGLADRVSVAQGDMFAGLADQRLLGLVDLVVCNPPYISTGKLETTSAHLLESEPREAFEAGPYGITIHQRLAAEAASFLRPGGWLAFEFGAGQDRQVKALLARTRHYGAPDLLTDESGIPRVALAQRL